MQTGLRVLIAAATDDADDWSARLRANGYSPEVRRAGTLDQARARLDAEAIDLVLVDDDFPALPAPALLALLCDRSPAPPAIVLSGRRGEERAAAMVRAGAYDFVSKANLERLGTAVASALAEPGAARSRPATAFSGLFEATSATMLLIDPNTGRIIDANRAASDYYGYPHQALVQMSIGDLNTLPREQIAAEMAQARLEKRRYFGFRHRLADGTVREVEVYSGPVSVDGRTLLYSIIHDVTERRRAEAALRDSEEKYRSIFENISEIFCINDLLIEDGRAVDWRVREANPAYERFFKVAPGEAAGRLGSEALLGTPVFPEVLEAFAQVVATGKPARVEIRLPGLGRHCLASAFSLGAERFAVVGLDLTERVNARLRLEAERARLHTVLDALPVGVLLVSPDERIAMANPAAAQMFGRDFTAARLDEYLRLKAWNPETGAPFAKRDWPVARALHDGETVFELPMEIGRADSTRATVLASAVALRGPRGEIVGAVAALRDVTERRRAEEALRISEARLDSFFNEIPAALAIVSRTLQLVRVNAEAAVLLGLPADQLIGRPVRELAFRFAHLEEPQLLRVLRGTPELNVEVSAELPGEPGVVRTWLASHFPIAPPDGRVHSVGVIALEITDRKRADQRLREARDQSEALNRISVEITSTLDTREIMRRVVVEATKALGAEAGALLVREAGGWSVREAHGYPPEILGVHLTEAQMRATTRAARERRPLALEDALHDPRASLETMSAYKIRSTLIVPLVTRGKVHGAIHFIYRTRARHFTDSQRDFAGRIGAAISLALGNAHSFEERERLLVEVSNRAAEMDAVFSSIATGVVVYSRDGRVVRMNPAAQELLLYQEPDWERPVQERLARLSPTTAEGKPFARGESPPERALRGETVRNVAMVVHRHDGRTLWLSSSGAPITTQDGRVLGAVTSIFDLTPLHELQEARKAYIHTISHDLRNPLSLIQGHARLLARELKRRGADRALSARVDTVLRASSQMNTLIQDLVDAARQEGGQLRLDLRPLDLRAFTTDLLGRSAPTLEVSRVRVKVPELPAVNADPERLERILVNLLSNALKYSPEGSPVELEAALEPGFVRLSVSDRGPGIAPEDLPHVFDRYFRGKATAKAEGVGLGLYTTRMLVEAHGGRVWVESEVGKGSRFQVMLPLAPGAAEAAAPPAR